MLHWPKFTSPWAEYLWMRLITSLFKAHAARDITAIGTGSGCRRASAIKRAAVHHEYTHAPCSRILRCATVRRVYCTALIRMWDIRSQPAWLRCARFAAHSIELTSNLNMTAQQQWLALNSSFEASKICQEIARRASRSLIKIND